MDRTTLSGPNGRTVRPFVSNSIVVKKKWSDSWSARPHVHPVRAEEAAGLTVGNAVFEYDYGRRLRPNNTQYGTWTPWIINDYYVKILSHTCFGTFSVWIGIINQDSREGMGVDPATGRETGVQTFGAVTLDYLLRANKMWGVYTEASAIFVERSHVFNRRARRGATVVGNRSTTPQGSGAHTFSVDGEVWNALQVLRYIIEFYVNDASDPDAIVWQITGQITALAQFVDVWDLRGMDPATAIDTLVSRRRGFGWTVDSSGAGVVSIFVFSIAPRAVSFGETTIPANPFPNVITMQSDNSTQQNIRENVAHRVRRIVAFGDTVRTCFSMQLDGTSIEAAWTAAEKTTYDDAPDKDRRSDAHPRVYSMFRLPPTWDWTPASVQNATALFISPQANRDGTLDTTRNGAVFNLGHSFDNFLPIEEPSEITGAEPKFVAPFVLVEDPDNLGKYHHVEALDVINKEGLSVRIEQSEAAFRVRGRFAHLFGLGTFGGDTTIAAETDYRTLIATMMINTDTEVLVDSALLSTDRIQSARELHLRVPDAHVWYIAPGTVIDVVDGDLVYSNGGADSLARDDTPRLRAIVAGAAAWHMLARNTVTVRLSTVTPAWLIGNMILSSQSARSTTVIGTPVTGRRFDFVQKELTFNTGYSELDFVAVHG